MDKAAREKVAQLAIAHSGADQTEAVVRSEHLGLTRFSHDSIHQNIAEANTTLQVRAIVGGRSAIATTNVLDDAAVRATVERAIERAGFAPVDPELPPLVRNQAPAQETTAASRATAAATPLRRSEAAAAVIGAARGSGFWCAGYIGTTSSGITVANSSGTLSSFDGTDAALNVKASGADSSGFAEAWHPDIDAIDAAACARRALDKAAGSRDPIAVEPGAWTVVLEPPALGELLAYLTYHFSAESVDEGRSFISRGVGQAYLGTDVTLRDDYANPLFSGAPFDPEGTPTQRLTLVRDGIVESLVTDAYWARKRKLADTGHASGDPSEGPQPRYVVLDGGSTPMADLIGGIKRGLLISRFWYIRNVDERRTIVTGMTRDGTFLIEDGKITHGVRNMRFNTGIVDALKAAEFSRETARTGGYSYSAVVPSAKIEGFAFSSGTEF